MLRETVFRAYTHGEIKPEGWLRRQLEIQAEGLSGHLDKVWPDIRDSRWIGGACDGWERVPYWLDGFIPLAYLLDDADMKRRARRYIDSILAQQDEDGWICPCAPQERRRYDMWALILIAKVLTVYADLSGDERVGQALMLALKQFDRHIDRNTLFNWGAARWYECLIPIFWLYERTGEDWLLRLAHKLEVEGVDYNLLFDRYRDQAPKRHWTYLTHVVNLAMALKQGALSSRLHGGDVDAFGKKALDILTKYHGTAVGHFTGDECVAGDSPIQGTELCGVVEAMYSYERLVEYGGNPCWSDQLERLAFNALPATMSPDMWTHQYDQLSNQVQCSRMPEDHVVFGTNGPESHLFGLEPNFGCCTANFSQGWPKFAMSTFMAAKDGLAVTAIAPSTVRTRMGDAAVIATIDTQYPFRDTYTVVVDTDTPTTFSLYLRIPGFAKAATVDGVAVPVGVLHRVERRWNGVVRVEVNLTLEAKLVARPRNLFCLQRGPLTFCVAPGERWEAHEYERDGVPRKAPYCDYEIFATSKWNYAFADDRFVLDQQSVGDCPFSPAGAPLGITATMVEIPWDMVHGTCTEQPASRTPCGTLEKVRLIPYGCTCLRMTEMPWEAESCSRQGNS